MSKDQSGDSVVSILRWAKISMISSCRLILTILVAGAMYQQIASANDKVEFPMPGSLVEVRGVKLHIHCTGPTSSSPSVILIPGMGSISSAWENVQKPLSKNWRTCSYDRDGLGWSEDSGQVRDVDIAADRLNQLLTSMKISPPFILVGHSYGGMVARVFADEYPEKVSGLVLVDSAHQDMGERFGPEAQAGFKSLLNSFNIAYFAHFSGFLRAVNAMAPAIDGLSGYSWQLSMSKLNTSQHMYGSAQEAEGWNRSAARTREITSLGQLPLSVFVALEWPEFMLPEWKVMQQELASLSSRGTVNFVEGANHSQVVMQSKYALEVVAEIESIISIRSKPLP